MTIGKRLIVLLAVPLVALLVLGVLSRVRLSEIEERSRFIAENQLEGVAALGGITASFAELRVTVRNVLLAADASERAAARATFVENEQTLARLLQQYGESLISDERDRQFLTDVRNLNRQYILEIRQVMALADEDRREEAVALFRRTAGPTGSSSPGCPASGSNTTRNSGVTRRAPPLSPSRKRVRRSSRQTWPRSCSRGLSASSRSAAS